MDSASSFTTKSSHSNAALSSAELYKTELCKAFMDPTKKCKYGPRCRYAHGEHQLRTPEENQRRGIVTEEDVNNWISRGHFLAEMRDERQKTRSSQQKKKPYRPNKKQETAVTETRQPESLLPVVDENPTQPLYYVHWFPLIIPVSCAQPSVLLPNDQPG